MRVLIFATQREIAQVITDQLSDKKHLCFTFHKIEQIQDAIENLTLQPDLLILDYLSFNHDYFDIYQHFEKHKYYIPIVFYNDPCLMKPSRCEHWIMQISFKQNSYLKMDLELLRPILLDLEELIESPIIKPYIPLLSSPKPLPPTFRRESSTLSYLEKTNSNIYDFKNRTHLRAGLFYILEILYNNQTQTLTMEDIITIYQIDGKRMTKNSLKVLISQLRRKIREDGECGFLIYAENKRYRFVQYR